MFKKMMPYKRKVGILITLANTTIIIIFSVLYIFIYYTYTVNDLRNSLFAEAEEIITKYISVTTDGLIEIDTANREDSIEKDLQTDGYSAILLNSNFEEIGRFGIFQDDIELLSEDSDRKHILNNAINKKDSYVYSELDLYEKNTYELLVYPIISSNSTYGILIIVAPTTTLQSSLKLSINVSLLIIGISLALNIWLGQIISTWISKPISKIISDMNKVDIDNSKSQVLVTGNPQDDHYKLAVKYNQMLSRINKGVAKQKQFISNASHELKSPIARVILSLDVIKSRLKKGSIQSGIELINTTQFELKDLGKMIHSLLHLSRVLESDLTKSEIDVNASLVRIIELFSTNKIKYTQKTQKKVLFNKDLFDLIIKNLIENAIKHGEEDIIKVETNISSNILTITISNKSNSKVPETNSRWNTSNKDGFGLGLSIISEIALQEGLIFDIIQNKGMFIARISGFDIVS